MKAKLCCCGHTRWEHRSNGNAACRVCDPVRSSEATCDFFHEARPSPWFLMFVAALLIFAAYACVKIHQRTTESGMKDEAPLKSGRASSIIFPTYASESAMNPNPLPPPIEHRFKPGNTANPGGAPRGKRISTWMAEFGEVPPSKWPKKDKLSKMPANARIAIVRLRKALDADKLGLANAEYVEPRQRPVDGDEAPRTPMLEQIAAAILALKAAGIDVRRQALANEAVEAVMQLPPPPLVEVATEEDKPGDARAKIFRRGRA